MNKNKIARELLILAKSLIAIPKLRLDSKTITKLNKAAYSFSTGHGNGNVYYDKIPLTDLFKSLNSNGVHAVQEDGTPWVGFLTGKEGHANIELAPFIDNEKAGQIYDNAELHINWTRMGSGRYEFLARVG